VVHLNQNLKYFTCFW